MPLEQMVFLELKMYYSKSTTCYDNDFKKLKLMVDLYPNSIGVQIHFYKNRNRPAMSYLTDTNLI